MIRYYIKHAFRIFKKDRIHSILNILGLSIGLTSGLLVLLYVYTAKTFDKGFEGNENIYKYGVNMQIGDSQPSTQSSCNAAVGPLLKNYIPGIKNFVRIANFNSLYGPALVRYNDVAIYERNCVFADSSLFTVFSHTFEKGNPKNCLTETNSAVISNSFAKKFFGEKDPIGEVIEIDNNGSFKITGVFKDLSANTHLQYDLVLSFSTIIQNMVKRFNTTEDQLLNPRNLGGGMMFEVYFQFNKNFSEKEFLEYFDKFYQEYMADFDVINYKAVVEPISDTFLNSKIWKWYSERNKRILFGFSSLGLLILILTCINYINLTTARAENRALEVGIKKSIGASKNKLIIQYLGESLIFSFIALIFALGLTEFILKFTNFNDLMNVEISTSVLLNSEVMFYAFGVAVITALISGVYPAFYLTNIVPVKALTNKVKAKHKHFSLRNLLVGIQMIISIGAIVLGLFMNKQIKYLLDKDLGFDKDKVIVVNISNEQVKQKLSLLKDELNKNPIFNSISISNTTPGYGSSGTAFEWETKEGTMEVQAFVIFQADKEYMKTMGIEIVEGTNYQKPRNVADTLYEFIVTESLVEYMGWENPIGKRNEMGKVVGVVRNFDYSSNHNNIRPAFFVQYNPERIPGLLNIRYTGNVNKAIAALEKAWNKNLADFPINYRFMDDAIAQMYQNDINQRKLNFIFCVFSIIISCLGLIGLISYTTQRKAKEIAIRKVYGASMQQLISKLFVNILVIVIIASVIASIFSYWLFDKWLENFTYQVNIDIVIIAASVVASIVASFAISFYHSYRIASQNPIVNLKYE